MWGFAKIAVHRDEAKARLQSFPGAESGATAMEYVLLAGLIAIGILVAVNFLGGTVLAMFSSTQSAMTF